MKKNETSAITALLDALSDTPLHEACRYGRPTPARLLLEAGADVNALNENEETVP